MSIDLTRREIATILAALRFWQTQPVPGLPAEIADIATDGWTLVPLYMPEVDALCERINTASAAPRQALAGDPGAPFDLGAQA